MEHLTVTQKHGEFVKIFTDIDTKKVKLDSLRPLTTGEAQRLRDEFMVDYTYNSNAIEGNTLTLKETAMVLEGMTIERIARFHLEFEGIHPFIDGNGRTGRLLLNLELIRNGYPAINVKFTDRKRYYDAFDTFYRDGKADDMILLFAEYIGKRLDRYLEIMKDTQN